MKAKKSTVGSREEANRARRPNPDELEISFFGPSYGESVAIHVGSGEWIIVDSCISPWSGKPQALEYFQELGVDPCSIKFIIVTHWDDDHIRGLFECVENAPNADIVISGAFASEDFTTILEVFDHNPIGISTGVREIHQTLKCIRERGKNPILAFANKSLVTQSKAEGLSLEVIALSPSDATVMDGHLNVGKLLQNVINHRIRLPAANRNDRSIVIWLKLGHAVALLGSDLEEVGDAQRGWSAIVFSEIKREKASAFKIPHHGSKSSHVDGIWTELLSPNPPAVITPWTKGFRALPTRHDIERFQKLTDKVFVTAVPQIKRRRRAPEVDQMIRHTVLDMRQVNSVCGHVRLRANAETTPTAWSTELFHGARKVEGRMARAFFDDRSVRNRRRPWL